MTLKPKEKDSIFIRAFEALNPAKWTEEELAQYEQAEKSRLDTKAQLNAAEIEGEAIGIAKTKQGFISNLIKEGVEMEKIKMYAEVNEEEFKQLMSS